uniref:Uncharacterized protein n=1 Tax=Meloidogyne enterolobii TaxID=390850 RepID=A0A6V7V9L6_MELEN|nr:unnamed protein product [Meloidogyne enterolobii]
MLVYTKPEGLVVQSEKFQVIPVPINEETLLNFGTADAYKDHERYFTIGIYKGKIIKNKIKIKTFHF